MRGGLVTILAVAMACGAIACGEDDPSDTASRAKAEPGAAQSTTDRSAAEPAAESTADGVTPPGGPRKMLGRFGRVPTPAERAAIATAVDRYHAAVAADDDARTCAQMSRTARRSIAQNVADGGSASCVDQIDIFHSGHSDALRAVLPDARITEIRVDGDQAIVIAFVPGPRTLKIPMELDRGVWRYGTFGKWTPPWL
ncbi:MAG TPA: hypothetical protein VEX36_09945 [Thermoleophilaceae bacterium]|nr:hypothetical protein [Thermoleophilaceae bacterium]